jgi:hypothetical protein
VGLSGLLGAAGNVIGNLFGRIGAGAVSDYIVKAAEAAIGNAMAGDLASKGLDANDMRPGECLPCPT